MDFDKEFDSLYEEYSKMIYRYIFLMCKNKELAEDIMQNTFLKAIQSIDSFEGKCKFSTWLCQTAKNEYFNYCRKYQRQQSYEEYVEARGEIPVTSEPYFPDQYLEKLIRNEDVGIICNAMQELPEPYKEVFMLRIYGELGFNEIGELFGKNATWARVTYFRAKEKIKKCLQHKEGFDEL